MPIDRTNKTALDSNLVNGVTSDAPKVKNNNDTLYNYVDGLEAAQNAHASNPTLAHPDGSVTGPKIKDGAVTTAKIADGAVTAPKIANGSITADKFVAGALTNETQNALRITEHDAQLADIVNRIQHVTYSMFGAPLNGIDDDTLFIKAAHEFANTNRLKIIQSTGIIYLKSIETNGPILVTTDMDISGCTLKIDQNMGEGTCFLVPPETEESITVTPQMQSEMVENAVYIPSLSDYKNSFFRVISDEDFATRVNGMVYKKQECFTVGTNGVITDGGLHQGFTSGSLTLTRKSIFERPVIVLCPLVQINTTDATKLATAFKISRNNVTMKNARIAVVDIPDSEATYTFKSSLFQFDFAFAPVIDGFLGENASTIDTPGSATQGQYVFNFTHCSYVDVRNCHLQRAWGVMNTEWVKTVTVRDCLMNRFDNHFGIGDTLIENFKTVGDNGCINIGWGKGTVAIRNVHQIYTEKNSNVHDRHTVTLRSDLGLFYEGVIDIDTVDVDICEDLQEFNVIIANLTPTIDQKWTRQIALPEIMVKNIRIRTKVAISSYIIVQVLQLYFNGSYVANKNIVVKNITMDTISINDEGSVNQLQALRIFNGSSNGLDFTKKYNISMKNIGIVVQSVLNLIDIDDITASTFIRSNMYLEKVIGNVATSNYAYINLRTLLYEGKVVAKITQISALQSTFHNLDVTTIQYADLLKCDLHFEMFRSGVVLNAVYDSCEIYPNSNVASTITQMKVTNSILRNCIIHPFSSLPVVIDGGNDAPLLLLNNVISGTAFNQYTTDRLYKYIKSSYAQPT